MSEVELSGQQMIGLMQSEEARLQNLEKNLLTLKDMFTEHEKAIEALKEFQECEGVQTVFLPLGAGVYIEATVTETKKINASLTGSVLQKMPVDVVIKRLEIRRDSLIADARKVEADIQGIAANLQKMQSVLTQMARPPQHNHNGLNHNH